MEKIDVRKLNYSARETLRKTVIRLHEQGYKQSTICKDLGLRPATVCGWVSRYKTSGDLGLKDKAPGRTTGQHRTLSLSQESRIKQDIIDKTPDQHKLAFALWNAKAVAAYIKQCFDITMPIRTVRLYLSRWGFTPQRPIKKAYEQQDKAVQRWLETDYPAIVKRAKKEGAEISWGDETGVSSSEHRPRGYAPKGQTPVLISSKASRTRVNLISTVNNRGELRFMSYKGSMNAQVLIRFLRQLIKHASQKVYLILDNLRVHHSKKVKHWLKDRSNQIELFFLPSYSPELNPDEYLNGDLKSEMNRRAPTRSEEEMRKKVRSCLCSLQKQPERVKAYFRHPKIAYAA